MKRALCPYCRVRLVRERERTCGTPHCVDAHVKLQAENAMSSEIEDDIFTRGYRCDSCGHEQEADVDCQSCGSPGVVPFGFSAPPDAIEDTARLYDTAFSPGEEERRRPRPGCNHCRVIGELCGLCERTESGDLPEPSAAVQRIAASTGQDPHTVALVLELERITRSHGLSRAQHALAQALWRSLAQHPMMRMTVDFLTSSIVLTDGGRRIRFEADVFPHRGNRT